MAERVGFSLGLPAGWTELPDAPGALSGDPAAPAGAARRRYLYLGVTGEPSPRAIATLELLPRGDATPDALLERAAGVATAPSALAPDSGGPRVWRARAGAVEIGGSPAVVVDQLVQLGGDPHTDDGGPGDGSRRLHRRILIAMFPGEESLAGAVAQLELSTPDFTAFDDQLAVALAMAESVRLRPVDATSAGVPA